MNRDTSLLVIITVVIVGGLIALFARGSSTSTTSSVDQATLVKGESHRIGASNGAVTLVEFGDFQCPACGQAHPLIKQLIANHATDLTFIFRNFPITSIHKNASLTSLAAEAADKQGKYWEMNDKLYENQSSWSESDTAGDIFAAYAKDLGLQVDQFKLDIQSKEVADRVAADVADATTLGVKATPTFYFNGVKYVGGLKLDDLEKAYQSALSSKK